MKRSLSQTGQQKLFETGTTIPVPQQPNVKKDYIFEILDALSAPMLTFSQLWVGAIPQRLLDIIKLSRMCALKKGEQLATYPECVIYLYTCALEAPMDSDWTDIYVHLTCQTLADWFNEDHWDEVKTPKQLSEWLAGKLIGLRRHIYNKRREILKQRLKSEEKIQADNIQSEVPKPVIIQQQFHFE